MDGFQRILENLREMADNRGYDFEVLDHNGLAKLIPGLGPTAAVDDHRAVHLSHPSYTTKGISILVLAA